MVENDLSLKKEMTNSPLIVAHRGASAYAPENTLAAFQMAIDAGCDGLEFDVRLAADGVPVVIHDSSLKRTGDIDQKVSRLTSQELAKIDVGSWFNKKSPKRARKEFENEPVASLAVVLGLLEKFSGLIYIEMKANDKTFAALSKAVCDIIETSPRLEQMIVKSFRLDAVLAVSRHLPEVQTATLFAPELDYIRHKERIIETARKFGGKQISVHHSLATKNLCALANKAQMPVTIWTADNPKWIERCRTRGIRALITNEPAEMLAARSVHYL